MNKNETKRIKTLSGAELAKRFRRLASHLGRDNAANGGSAAAPGACGVSGAGDAEELSLFVPVVQATSSCVDGGNAANEEQAASGGIGGKTTGKKGEDMERKIEMLGDVPAKICRKAAWLLAGQVEWKKIQRNPRIKSARVTNKYRLVKTDGNATILLTDHKHYDRLIMA